MIYPASEGLPVNGAEHAGRYLSNDRNGSKISVYSNIVNLNSKN
jgi:hypothetical protein